MKTKYNYLLLLFLVPIGIWSQNNNKPPTQEAIFAQEIVKTVEKNLAVKPPILGVRTTRCDPHEYMQEFNVKDLLPDPGKFEVFLKNLDITYKNKLKNLKLEIGIPKGQNIEDFALEKLAKSKNLNDFVDELTKKSLEYLYEEEQELLIDFKINHPIKKKIEIQAKGKKIARSEERPCFATSNTVLKLANWDKYPEVYWDLDTKITIVCDCERAYITDLKNGSIEYSALIQSFFSTKDKRFIKAKLFGPMNVTKSCCEDEDPREEPIEEPIEEEGVPVPEYIPPKQTLGVNGGIGFQQDFEEISICLGAEYLYNVTSLGNHPLYVGGQAKFITNSFMDFSSTQVHVGPTVQLFSPITRCADVHVTNGISGSYIFGSQENNGFKDDISGFDIVLNTGLNIRLNEKVSISIIIPVFSYQNISLEAQEGGSSFDISETTLLLNKNNPAQLGVRFKI
ncbi:MAG: hypothetical protein AAGH46_03335 [Bacteroidota bacterium]